MTSFNMRGLGRSSLGLLHSTIDIIREYIPQLSAIECIIGGGGAAQPSQETAGSAW